MNKVKFAVVLTDPEDFIRDPKDSTAFWLGPEDCAPYNDDWRFVQNVEVDIDLIDTGAVIDTAAKKIDEDIVKAEGVIIELKRRKAELLALPAPETES